MLLTYLPVLLMILFVAVLSSIVLFINSVLSPKNPYEDKLSPWECGMDPVGEADTGHFRVHYFIIAILFVIFDVETVFLFPWAVVLKKVGIFAFIDMFIFIAMLAVGLVYAWTKGALEWI